MKGVGIYSIVLLVIGTGLLTSCLSGTDDEQGNAFGIAQVSTKSSVVYLNALNIGNLYSADIEKELIPGDCYWFRFSTKPEDLADIQNKEYVTSSLTDLRKLDQTSGLVTTEKIALEPRENSLPISKVVPVAVINNHLFLGTKLDSLVNYAVKYQIFYNMDSVITETDGNTYSLYLFAEKQVTEASSLVETYTAHNLQEFYEKAVAKENSDTTTVIRCKLNYINRLVHDADTIRYSTTSVTESVLFPVTK